MTYQATILADSPVAYWRLNEPSGTSAADSTANANTGTYTGTFALGASSPITNTATPGALDIHGAAGYVAVPNSATLNITSTVSLELWVKANSSSPGTFKWLINKTDNPGGQGYGIYTGSNTSLYFLLGIGGVATLTNDPTYTWDTNWHQIVATYDNANMKVYKDGAILSAATKAATGGITDSSGDALHIGEFLGGGGGFPGYFTEVAVYATALSAGQVLAHYNDATAAAAATASTLPGRFDIRDL